MRKVVMFGFLAVLWAFLAANGSGLWAVFLVGMGWGALFMLFKSIDDLRREQNAHRDSNPGS